MPKSLRLAFVSALALSMTLAGCGGGGGGDGGGSPTPTPAPAPTPSPTPAPTPTPTGFVGAIYAGTNRPGGNTVAAFGRGDSGLLSPIAEFGTGGAGGVFDGTNDGLDPLISEDSLLVVDNRFLLAVNAGSATITSFRINADFSLTFVNSAPTGGFGPNSIAYRNGIAYVTNVDVDGVFTGAADQSGNLTGFRLDTTSGQISNLAGSTRTLGARPSDVEFSTDGRNIVVASYNAGSSRLAGGSQAEIQSFGVMAGGNLTGAALASTASTPRGNSAGRNLAGAIGFEIVERGGRQIVIVTESREFLPNGDPAMPTMFQTGSVSTWELGADGSFTARSLDVRTGPTLTSGPTSACWVVVSPDRTIFWVASASGAAISSYRLNADGTTALIASAAASGAPANPNAPDPLAAADGFIDLTLSGDGRFLYQLLGLRGTVNVYEVGANGALTLRQRVTALLPMRNVQGLVSAGQ